MDRNTSVDAPTLNDLWAAQARWYAHEPAFMYNGSRKSYGEVAQRARQLASALHRVGMRSQDRLAVLGMNSDLYLEIYAAGEQAGFITTTVNFRLAAPEVDHIVADAGPLVLFFDGQFSPLLALTRARGRSIRQFVCLSGDPPGLGNGLRGLSERGRCRWCAVASAVAQDIAYLIYTSGTTGRPKGCMLDHASQVATARYVAELLQLSASSRTLLVMPLYHVGAKMLQLGQCWSGGQVHIQRQFDVETMLVTIAAERITNLHLAPQMIQAVLEYPGIADHDLSSVRSVCYAAAPMRESVLRKGLALLGPVFVQFWGQTEGWGTCLPSSEHRLEGNARERRRLLSIGHPLPGVRMRVVDDEDCDVTPGQPGELILKAPTVMQGYWNQSAATVETLRGGWLHSGDICTCDEDGYLYLIDRKKDMIISGGENIYSREVEDVLADHPAISDCAVIGIPDAVWGEAVAAVVVLRAGMTLTGTELIEHCGKQIAGYKRPRRLIVVDQLPRLPSGKVSKAALRAQFARDTEYAAIEHLA